MTYVDKLSNNKQLAYYFKKVFHLTPDDIELKLIEQNFITCVSVQVDLRVLKKSSINKYWFQTSICCAEKGGSERAAFFNARNTLKSIRQ